MANPQTEPTMDEILASIRRIISEEDEAPAGSAPKLEPLELDEASSVSIGDDDVVEEATAEAEPAPEAAPESIQEETPAPAEPTVSLVEPTPEKTPSEKEATADPAPQPEPVAPGPVAQTDPLDELVAAQPAPGPAEPQSDAIDFADITEKATRAATASLAEGLISDHSAKQASDAFGSLHDNVRVSNGSGRTIEDLVESMLQPMIQGWLDQNLPRIVEEKVEEEVRRIARRR